MATLLLPQFDDVGDDAEPAVSRFELSRFIGGELTSERRTAIEQLLATDAALKAQYDQLVVDERAADAALKLEVPLERFLADHAHKTRSPFAFLQNLKLQFTVGALAAGALTVFFLVRPAEPAYDGLKGPGARVGFFVKDEHNARFGHDGELLGAGDQIQFAVKDTSASSAMVLVGVDGRGAVTVYAAERTDGERPKGDSKTRLLPASVVLDDATGAERFFVVYGDGSVDDVKSTVEQAAHALASSHDDLVSTDRLPLPSSFVQSSVHIMKVAR